MSHDGATAAVPPPTAQRLDEETLQRLEQLAQIGTPRPWYVAGPPWVSETPSWVQAGSDDPHQAVAILQPPDDIVYDPNPAPTWAELAENLEIRRGFTGRRRELLGRVAVSDPARVSSPWIWLVASVEDQKRADERLDWLKRCPAAVRGVSYEPALEPVNFCPWLPSLHWLIVGGESGVDARPCSLEWIRAARDQADAFGVPVFVKQMGAVLAAYRRASLADPLLREALLQVGPSTCHPKGADISEWAADLRRQEWPRVRGAALDPAALRLMYREDPALRAEVMADLLAPETAHVAPAPTGERCR